MKKLYILLIVLLIYLIQSGVVNGNYDLWAEETTDKNLFIKELIIKVPNDEWPTSVVFDTVHVCYQGTVRWIIMANPNLIGQSVPNHIARTMTVHCFCVLDKIRTKYKLTPYTNLLGGDDPMNPQFLPRLFMTTAVECIKEHNTLFGLVVLDPSFNIDDVLKIDNETKNDTKIEVKPPDNNSGKSDSTPEQPKELPTEDVPLLNF